MGFSFCWILKMYCWADIINDICYKLFNYIQCIWVSFFFSPSTQFISTCLLIDIWIFVLARRIFRNIIAVHITDLFLFLNLTKGSLEVSEYRYQLSFGPSVIHAGHSFLLNLITSLQWYTEIKKTKQKKYLHY